MPLIDVQDVIKTYPSGDNCFNALDNVSLQINYGEFVAIMGASGSGKSTFMNMIGCLDKQTSGKYYLDGIDVSTITGDDLARIRNKKLGFVFQGFNLIARTSALENTELPMVYAGISPEERIKRATQALELVGLGQRLTHMPNEMSGGQQQRVAIARALVNDAPVILADEPTGNLDTKTSIEVMNLFVELNDKQKKTIVLVTHEPDIAAYAKRVVTFSDGKIVKDEVKR